MPRIRTQNDYFEYVESISPVLNNIVSIIRNTETHTYNLVSRNNTSTIFSPNPFTNTTTTPPSILFNPFSANTPNNTQNNTQNNTPTNSRNGIEELLNNLSPVTVRPTNSQIHRATTVVPFNTIENPINTTCPICHDSFDNNEFVMQIRHCRHIFNERTLLRWFNGSVRCPVCRYDIRDYGNTPTEAPPLPESSTLIEPEIDSSIVEINEIGNNTDSSNNSMITYENVTDISNNSVLINTTINGNLEDSSTYNHLIQEISTIIADTIVARNNDNQSSFGRFNVEYNIYSMS